MTSITPEQATQFMHAAVPPVGRMGVTVEALGPGWLDLRVPLEGNSNHFGVMYAGVLFTIAEVPGGLLPLVVLDPSKYTPIVTRLDIRFVAAARTDITLSAAMEPGYLQRLAEQADTEGRAEFTLELTATDTSGRTVLESTGWYQLRPNRG